MEARDRQRDVDQSSRPGAGGTEWSSSPLPKMPRPRQSAQAVEEIPFGFGERPTNVDAFVVDMRSGYDRF